ncbi:MAG: 3-dehydroquinate synthase II, partial [Candidatus Korarchaeum sp.]|nr:3-dehydroquinate synthase II [Candidatus Korarchaeum sp.]MDW8035875.1 3-dehydroquinate synthase II [Candidatus Korarchaeum sp.]
SFVKIELKLEEEMPSGKELIVLADSSPDSVIEKAVKMGIKVAAIDESAEVRLRELVSSSMLIKVDEWPSRGELTLFRIKGPEDIDTLRRDLQDSKVLIDSEGWRIIPLENIIAAIGSERVYAIANSLDDARSMLGVLEIGVKGVVIPVSDLSQLESLIRLSEEANPLPLRPAKVTEVKQIGMGDRVCVDTTSMLSKGEGMLVGGSASFFLLIHSENIESPFTTPREFRVNAGAVSNYTLAPGGRTLYLSEVRSGSEVIAVSRDGRRRAVSVGRAKIERRPLVLVRAASDGEEGWVVLQLAETIPLVSPDGSTIAVTELKSGDSILAHISPKKARHFGTAVEEFIEER